MAHPLFDVFAVLVVVLAGLYLVCLGAVAAARPDRAARFLLGFARSASTHALELALRLVVGWAFVQHADAMPFAMVFKTFGWLLLVTTAGLMLVPWRLHLRFAQRMVPEALRHLWLIAITSLAFGGFVLGCTFVSISSERSARLAAGVDVSDLPQRSGVGKMPTPFDDRC